VGHSFGGLVVRLYASAYPDEVVGFVLIDAANEELYPAWETLLGPAPWAELMRRTWQPPEGLEGYQDFERLDLDGSVAQGRQAREGQPLHPMPLAVLTHGRAFEALVPDWPSEAFERLWLRMQQDLAALVPHARFTIASQSGHAIQQDQPALVNEAIRQVVMGVRDRPTWYDLAACCAQTRWVGMAPWTSWSLRGSGGPDNRDAVAAPNASGVGEHQRDASRCRRR
jgi:pimeloyl-ACP methyl ester carboxylesterase